ncbi:hypothetical protein [Prevotella sp. HUN102]|uniref:hypothetical protein n=1 Tax=Prevotella sp. HUN102 TaxID=1392486 RepID=UPI000490D7DC|nr:hypothetical protein [Prevotella sp. HUN102]
MKAKDFEKAIDALSADITIDEMKLQHSNVRQVNAHTNSQLVVWDEYGRAFSASRESKKDIFLTNGEDGNIVCKSGFPLSRDKSFDLKFE